MENTDIQAAERPYVGNELSMVVLMPRQKDACGQHGG
jgi:serine protease inhibitor